MKKIFYVIAIFLFFNSSVFSKDIIVWNYYNSIPFVTSKKTGLAQDFVNLLNKYSNNQYNFKLHTIPRKRLNIYLQNNYQGIVLFVNPVWMGKNASTKYLWTQSFLEDQNEIISSTKKKIYFKEPFLLRNKTIATIRGRKYKDFSEMLQKKQLENIIVEKEEQSLLLVSLNRADFTTQPRTIVMPLIKKLHIEDKIFISPEPLFSFSRHIMITRPQYKLHEFLSNFTKDLKNKQEWKEILKKYNLN